MTLTSTPRKPRSKKPTLPAAPAPAEIQDAPAAAVDLAEHAPTLAYDQPTSRHPLGLLVASPLNPRKHFDETALKELAESIFHQGLLQNLVARRIDDTRLEVIAGGRRLRALQMLQAEGRINGGYLVPVREQALTDLEALRLAVSENVARRDMSPLEEADAFAQMVAWGDSAESIGLRFEYSAKTVEQRLVLARDLGKDARKLLDDQKITLGQAQVIAQTSGPLRKHVLEAAKSGESESRLRTMIKASSFLVEHAQFDVAASGLEIIRDLFGDNPERFADPKAALSLQLDWVDAKAEKLRAKGKHHFVEVLKKDTAYSGNLRVGYPDYDTYTSHKELAGIVLGVSTITGEVVESSGIARKSDIAAKERALAGEKKGDEAAGRPIPESTYLEAHELRARASRAAVLGNTHLTLAMTVWGLIQGSEGGSGRVHLGDVNGGGTPDWLPAELQTRLEALATLIMPAALKPKEGVRISKLANPSGRGVDPKVLLQLLLTLRDEELLGHLNTLVAVTAYDWYFNTRPPADEYVLIASLTDAPAQLAQDFVLTDASLKRYPRAHLLALAKEAGLDAKLLAGLKTAKEIRGQILQDAERLHSEGFVPKLVQFPKVKA